MYVYTRYLLNKVYYNTSLIIIIIIRNYNITKQKDSTNVNVFMTPIVIIHETHVRFR